MSLLLFRDDGVDVHYTLLTKSFKGSKGSGCKSCLDGQNAKIDIVDTK